MRALLSVCSMTAISLLSACTSWPNEGQGGFAEHYSKSLISVEHNQPLREEHGLRFDYTLVKNQLSLLKLQGAYYCFPASVDDANVLEIRIARELSGGLYDSASVNIVNQRIALTQLENKLDNILNQEKCIPPVEHNQQSNRHALLRLLNTDNQFAVGSSELNQKYKRNLEIASKSLQRSSVLHILIVGNTDTEGSQHDNLALSRMRALAVRNYLVELGINADNIDIIASGESSPIYSGDSDASRLINRNVRVYLLEG